jgi:NADH:ubiquinone oxidoreductase subunit 3 (subunit A)
MSEIVLSPPLAFVLYLALVAILAFGGRILAGRSTSSALKSSSYASGEEPPAGTGIPGYRPFFLIALFFAMLHLGILVLGTSNLTALAGVYLVGLILALVALILG